MKDVLIMFGGISPEHEVSIITGLQVVENIDREKYTPHVVYVSKKGEFKYLGNLTTRKDFDAEKGTEVQFGKDSEGGFISAGGLWKKKYHPTAVYMAFHGGLGEGGQVQSILEHLNIPFTCTTAESSFICMNKQLTKDVVISMGVPVIEGVSISSKTIRVSSQELTKQISSELGLPLIIKPVHFGSSIGISIAKTEIELEKALIEASHVDSEILVEKLAKDFKEYNVAVRQINGELECSEIEKPFSQDEILSFADKYERGGKKTGSGMASLQRELPAKISVKLQEKINDLAKRAFTACRCKGMVRIDFMVLSDDQIYLTEINPIPGSMAFYLWEASGISFTQQISDLLEECITNSPSKELSLDYKSDIVKKFVNSK